MTTDKPGPTVDHPTRFPDDRDTHIERINAGSNPADGTGASPGAAPGAPPRPDDSDKFGPLQPYRLLATAFMGGVLRKAGETVMLYAHQVGAHHQPLTDDGRIVDQPTGRLAELRRLQRGGDRIALGMGSVTDQPAPAAAPEAEAAPHDAPAAETASDETAAG